ncbi:hypothetical protein Ahy_B09g094537 [Arachis hypogaea]|uniref:Zinc knuckle CX2CX4HX4C domain-containing protein n=1 Tax=Arachis hypogaea TaxID=3818 RepID=A0A444XBG6_ARAHY|nr:hypothetical protein Ahy_B09g094537 [Arachis hypogaea]
MSNTNTIPDTQNTTQDQEDEEFLVVFNNEDVKKGLQECKNSLIERLLTKKRINSAWIQSGMQNIWKKPEKTDLNRVLKRKIASALGVVKECDVFENTRDQVRFIKAIVTLNINKPILKGTNIGSNEDGLIWTDFKYEKLPNFCYYCGLIGHEKSNFQQAIDDKEKGENKSKELGPG